MVKRAVECRLIKSVSSLAFGQSNPHLFRNFQRLWLSWCTFEGPFRYQLKHVKGKSPGSAELKDANSKWVSSGSWTEPRRGAEFRKVFEYREAKMGTVNSKRKFVSFNGLPIKPSFSTVDLSNKIMNHVTPNDFIEFPLFGSKDFYHRLL